MLNLVNNYNRKVRSTVTVYTRSSIAQSDVLLTVQDNKLRKHKGAQRTVTEKNYNKLFDIPK
jgi:hypothetical protein